MVYRWQVPGVRRMRCYILKPDNSEISETSTINGQYIVAKRLIVVVPPAGIEPAAPGLGIRCSIH